MNQVQRSRHRRSKPVNSPGRAGLARAAGRRGASSPSPAVRVQQYKPCRRCGNTTLKTSDGLCGGCGYYTMGR